jgi:membrane protease YdiL (CAAX protease family)
MIRRALAALQSNGEFLFIVIVAFGWPIFGSLFHLFFDFDRPSITPSGLPRLIVSEVVLFTLLGLVLRQGGWTPARLGATFHRSDPIVAIVLLMVVLFTPNLLWQLIAMISPKLASSASQVPIVWGHFELLPVALTSLVNPIFEETFLCGYLITYLKNTTNPSTAVSVSVAVRLTCHLYQGAAGVVGIAPMALVFACWFARTGRLWPLVICHALQDFVALAGYIG